MRRSPIVVAQVVLNASAQAAVRYCAGGVDLDVRVAPIAATALVDADDGVGIPAEHLPRVFGRFYRVDTARDRAHGGSGVGLAIAKVITQAHGGTITVHNDGPGRGARFTVTLPAVPSPG